MPYSRSRVARGRKTQELGAQWFRENGWPEAASRPASLPGTDIYNMGLWSPEVKAVPGDLTGALHQAHKNRGNGFPFVLWRPNGYGPERIEQWPVITRLDDFTRMMRYWDGNP